MSTRERLADFFGGYFHQDWDDESGNTAGAVGLYRRDQPDPVERRALADELEQLVRTSANDAALEHVLFDELGCFYDPRGEGKSLRDWLAEVLTLLRDEPASLKKQILTFLDRYFPGSSLDDGYFFVVIKAAHERKIRPGSSQRIVDALCADRSWLVCVGGLPSSKVLASRVETDAVTYRPEWNVAVPMKQWLLALDHAHVDLAAITRDMSTNSALVLINPDRRLVFHVSFGRLYAASPADLAPFAADVDP